MEGWSRSQTGARTGLSIAKAAERPTREDERSTQQTWRRLSPRNALPNAGVDAGCKSASVEGKVSLDLLLYGPATCTTAGATTWQTDRAPENVYYVVVPRNGDNKRSYGWAGSAPVYSERPVSESACFPQVVGACPS